MNMSFEPGAPAAEGFIPLCVPHMGGNEWVYIKDCLDTNWVSSVGAYVNRFESMLAGYVGARHAVAVVNGTAALHIALLVCGVQPDDEVIVSTLTFIAPVNAIRYAGAWPVLADAEPAYWQMDVEHVLDFLEKGCQWQAGELRNRASGRRVKAIIPVHILGHPVDMDPLMEAARRYRLAVIEDATESLGALYRDRKVGALGDMACFSFNGNKLITTGGGGMIVTDNQKWAERARYLTTQAKDDPLEFVHGAIGYNYRLTNVLAAMGCAQMENLEDYIQAKRRIAQAYRQAIADVDGLHPMPAADWAFSACWMYTILVDEARYGCGSRDLLCRLEGAGIQTRPLWRPAHMNVMYRDSQTLGGAVSERLHRQSISLPCSVGLTPQEQGRVITALAT
jgi:perosamine synthetase